MVLFKIEEIASLKNSEPLLQKIEEIKTVLKEINVNIEKRSSFVYEKNVMEFEAKISFPAETRLCLTPIEEKPDNEGQFLRAFKDTI